MLRVLRDYQVEGTVFLRRVRKGLIPLPVGGGKTPIALEPMIEPEIKRILIICSGNALYTWIRNLKEWLPGKFTSADVIEKMNKDKRKKHWLDKTSQVTICKYGTFLRDWEQILLSYDAIICDEPHRYLKNKKTKTFAAFQRFCARLEKIRPNYYLIFTTGTPISRGRHEFWPILNLCRPKRFGSYWNFINKFCDVCDGQFGIEIGGPINNDEFERVTSDVIFRPQSPIILPKIIRSYIDVEMDAGQYKLYNSLVENMLAELPSGDMVVTPNQLSKLLRLRQILNCPAIFDTSLGVGGAVSGILDHIEDDPIERGHAVIFTPFPSSIPHIERFFHENGYPTLAKFETGATSDQIRKSEEAFRGSRKGLAICSLLFAQSYELESAQGCYFPHYDWDQNNNYQAEGRLRRLTRIDDTVKAYYCKYMNSVDTEVLDVLHYKVVNTKYDVSKFVGQELKRLVQPSNSY